MQGSIFINKFHSVFGIRFFVHVDIVWGVGKDEGKGTTKAATRETRADQVGGGVSG